MKKLKLNKETIRNLTASELKGVAGGAFTDPLFCPTYGEGWTCRQSQGGVCQITCSCPAGCVTGRCPTELAGCSVQWCPVP